MTGVKASPGEIRVVVCLKFAQKAPFKAIADLKRSLLASEGVLESAEVSGSFDLMVEIGFDSLAAYQEMHERFAASSNDLIERYEASFVCRRYSSNGNGDPQLLWVPSASGMQRVELDRIDKVVADGDYVKVHSNGASWLVHTTLKSLCERLDPRRFLRLNRSLVVRSEFIERLLHDDRHWIVRLFDGSAHRIAKARSSEIVAALKADSSLNHPPSSNVVKLTEHPSRVAEKLVR